MFIGANIQAILNGIDQGVFLNASHAAMLISI
jgi:hypothetical protein